MPQKRLTKQALLAKVKGKRPVGRQQPAHWNDQYIEDIGWNRLGLHPSEMMNIVTDRNMR